VSVLLVTARLSAPVATSQAIHLDSVLLQAHPDVHGAPLSRGDPETAIVVPPLPIARIDALGAWTFVCSAHALPEEARRGREHLVKRKDAEDVEHRARRWTPRSGHERIYHLPVPTLLTPRLSWVCVGDRRGVMELLRRVRSVGAMRRHGFGAVVEWVVERVDEAPARAIVDAGGRAARHLPAEWTTMADAIDVGPSAPPYWHPARARARVPAGSRCTLRPEVDEVLARCR
jgi:hypothetical protein